MEIFSSSAGDIYIAAKKLQRPMAPNLRVVTSFEEAMVLMVCSDEKKSKFHNMGCTEQKPSQEYR